MSNRVLQINTTVNCGSTGRIVESIGECAINSGWDSWIIYGRGHPKSVSNLIRIGNDFDMCWHGIQTRIFDNHGLKSSRATKDLIRKIINIKPDVIHLHNIHGYYINYKILFTFLKEWGGAVVWTLHDCWPFTGHCAYYDFERCDKWKTGCHHCPQLKSYPSSYIFDRSSKNYYEKYRSFYGCRNLTLVPVSKWLRDELKSSFLSHYPAKIIRNGVDLELFNPKDIKKDKKHILGVANVWEHRKGLSEFIKLRQLLPEDYKITIIGLNGKQINDLPDGIHGIKRTENVERLAEYYSMATVFINPTLEDNFPTTNLEALACGTPVITYRTGGSPEAINDSTGIIIEPHDVEGLAKSIVFCCEHDLFSIKKCRLRAEAFFNKNYLYKEYIQLYNSLVSK